MNSGHELTSFGWAVSHVLVFLWEYIGVLNHPGLQSNVFLHVLQPVSTERCGVVADEYAISEIRSLLQVCYISFLEVQVCTRHIEQEFTIKSLEGSNLHCPKSLTML